jgi:high-affinity iron transporter
LYWVAVIVGFLFLGWKERKEVAATAEAEDMSETSSGHAEVAGKKTSEEGHVVESKVTEIRA